MKKSLFLYLLLSGFGFVSCNKSQSQKDIDEQALAEKPVSVQCYVAFYEKDTVDLKIKTLKNGKITGDMDMKLENRPIKKGEISGEFRGDTLFAYYSFIQGSNDQVKFKNPMAFLKSGNELILGNGKILTYLGTSYFAKGEPIDFESVKYKFAPVDCTEK